MLGAPGPPLAVPFSLHWVAAPLVVTIVSKDANRSIMERQGHPASILPGPFISGPPPERNLQEQHWQECPRSPEPSLGRNDPRPPPTVQKTSPPAHFCAQGGPWAPFLSGAEDEENEAEPVMGPTPSSVLELCQRLKALVASCRESARLREGIGDLASPINNRCASLLLYFVDAHP